MQKYLGIFCSLLVVGASAFIYHKLRNKAGPSLVDVGAIMKSGDKSALIDSSKSTLESERASRKVSSKKEESAVDEFNNSSVKPWEISHEYDGRIKKISGSSYAVGESDPVLAAHKFLEKYGKSLFGFPVESASLVSVSREEVNSQVVFEQVVNGFKVYGTRVSLFFDDKGNLIYAVSDVCPSANSAPPFLMDESAAVGIARAGLINHLKISDGGSQYPKNLFSSSLEKALSCSAGQISAIYHFIVPLQAPEFGDMEIEIDGRIGAITKMKNLARM